MKLYHYSKEFFSSLLTREKQNTCTPKELQEAIEFAKWGSRVGPYTQHISFFFEPVPLVLLGRIFGDGNDTWKKGNQLYEYCVDVDTLNKNVIYEIVETPDDTKHLDATDWIDTDEFLQAYLREKSIRKKRSGEIGFTLKDFKKQMSKYVGTTEEFYLEASKRHDFKDNIKMYAASVPHTMVYPPEGVVKIESYRNVVVGVDNAKNKVYLESLSVSNQYMRW